MQRRSGLMGGALGIKLERRPELSKTWSVFVTLMFLGLAFLLSGAIFQLLGYSALEIYSAFARTVLSQAMVEEIFRKSAPIILAAIGLSYSYRLNFWNIGAEGQLYMGMIASTGVVVLNYAGVLPGGPLLLFFTVAASALAGGVWSLIPAALRVRVGANEIITTLMLNYTAILLADYLVHGPWKDPAGYGFAQTIQFPPEARLAPPGTPEWAVFLAIASACAGATYFVFKYTVYGFESKVVGLNPYASRYAGIRSGSVIIKGVFVSGVLAGLAGLIVAGNLIGRLRPGASPGYGYHAIIAALLGGLNPPIVLLASLLFGMLLTSGDVLQASLQMPKAGVQIIIAMIFITTITAEFVKRHRIRVVRRRGGAV
jgi:ABC-type uncharacterized transport system permease subunit